MDYFLSMNNKLLISVCSRSFSNNLKLRKMLENKYSNVKYNNKGRLSGKNLINFLKDSDGAIIGLEKLDQSILKYLPKLKIISKFGVGLNNIDINYIKKKNIKLGWTKGVNKRSVSELTLSLMIILLRKLKENSSKKNIINWKQNIGDNLTGMTVGIIGCGNVGKDLIELLKPFKCKILVNDIKNYKDFYTKNHIRSCSLNYLLKNSDVISIHTPLNKSTKNLINLTNIKLLKQKSFLINTSRGGIINERALLRNLKNNKDFYAASDVFENEPKIKLDFLKLDNFIVLPHIGGSTTQSIYQMGLSAIKGLEKYIDLSQKDNYE